MTPEISFTLLVCLITVGLFISERLRVDLVAALAMTCFLVSGILTPEQGIAGFSNPATVTVAALFVLSAGLHRTGALTGLTGLLMRIGKGSPWRATVALMVMMVILSGFINNTAAVAIFLPITVRLARECGLSPSKLLMPLSFASLFGGACTLIGTSTNILVSSIAKDHGLRAFGMFEMAPLGLLLAVCGMLYMLAVGIPLLPSTGEETDLEEEFELAPYLCELILLPDSPNCGKTIEEAPLTQELDLDILELRRAGYNHWNPTAEFRLEPGDLLRVRCSVRLLMAQAKAQGVAFKTEEERSDRVYVEAVVAPGSSLVGHSLRSYRFRERFPATAIALRRQQSIQHSRLASARLQVGDVLLLATHTAVLGRLRRHPAFVLVSQLEAVEDRGRLKWWAVATLLGVVLLSALNLLPIVVAALLGCAVMLTLGCLTPDEAYEAIDWKVIILLGGMLTLGAAVQETGAALLIAETLVGLVGELGPWVAVSAFYLVTSFLTEALSNSATAVLLAPVAIVAAESLQVDPRPFLMAITFAASSSFMSPVGYQTNTMIHGPGRYRFSDFLRVGLPLNLLFWVLATVLIPRIWPF